MVNFLFSLAGITKGAGHHEKEPQMGLKYVLRN